MTNSPADPLKVDKRLVIGLGVAVVAGGLAVASLVTAEPAIDVFAALSALTAAAVLVWVAMRLSVTSELVAGSQARAQLAEGGREEMAARAAKFEAEALKAKGGIGSSYLSAATADLTRVTDGETGLFNTAFFAVTLDKRVAAARRGLRPLALALLEPVTDVTGDDPTPAVDKTVADCLVETLRDSDVACRVNASQVALILEDTPENGAVWTVERVRRRVASIRNGVTLRAGIACYPAHSFDAEHLLDAAKSALVTAKDWHQDRIEVAVLPEE